MDFLILAIIAIGIASFELFIAFVGEGNVRHVETYLTEQIAQPIAFEENGSARAEDVFGTGGGGA